MKVKKKDMEANNLKWNLKLGRELQNQGKNEIQTVEHLIFWHKNENQKPC